MFYEVSRATGLGVALVCLPVCLSVGAAHDGHVVLAPAPTYPWPARQVLKFSAQAR
ncbi:hypothetical protein JOD49_001179 [Oerskovia jenensis]|uniref:Uncharacterized protein n=1 Tax=Oerskovia jenensis TaxID=162169 RepID=A0ABS2LEK9_9CELL|nr:hypothetical protein [Oerskovia jenensis]